MIRGDRELIVVGDRVLIRLEEANNRTAVGLYLPPTALEKENVQTGIIEEVGPGIPLPPKPDDDEAPWSEESGEQMRYIPLQALKGDQVLFLRKDAIEITFEGDKYVVAPHVAILALIRSTGLLNSDDILEGEGL
jgi:co-chaperonin GroES (HSP10)